MLEFFKKFFSSKPAETPAPYKVEVTAPKVGEFPFPETKPAKQVKKPAVKKPAVKANTTRKPRTPKV
jgi:hypothetical protein